MFTNCQFQIWQRDASVQSVTAYVSRGVDAQVEISESRLFGRKNDDDDDGNNDYNASRRATSSSSVPRAERDAGPKEERSEAGRHHRQHLHPAGLQLVRHQKPRMGGRILQQRVRDQALQGHLCCFCRRKNEGRKCWLLIYSCYTFIVMAWMWKNVKSCSTCATVKDIRVTYDMLMF